jgi:hypothetical protein
MSTDVSGHSAINLRPTAAQVNLNELKELVEDVYSQEEVAVFTKRFSNKPNKKAISRTQINRFLNGNLSRNSPDYDIIKITLEWLMNVEIIFDDKRIPHPVLGRP